MRQKEAGVPKREEATHATTFRCNAINARKLQERSCQPRDAKKRFLECEAILVRSKNGLAPSALNIARALYSKHVPMSSGSKHAGTARHGCHIISASRFPELGDRRHPNTKPKNRCPKRFWAWRCFLLDVPITHVWGSPWSSSWPPIRGMLGYAATHGDFCAELKTPPRGRRGRPDCA